MKCPNCNSEKNRVIDTRKYDSVIFRLRFCEDCSNKFKTEELTIEFEAQTTQNHHLTPENTKKPMF